MWHKSSKMVILSSKLILQEVFMSLRKLCIIKTLQNACGIESLSRIPFNYCQLQEQPQFPCLLYTSDKEFRKNWQLAVEQPKEEGKKLYSRFPINFLFKWKSEKKKLGKLEMT